MRVNEVIITRIDGASDSTVNSATSWMIRSFRRAGSGALTEIDADILRGKRRRRNNEGRY
jgi:hypothetical protein